MGRALQRLRREAGYRTANDFADAVRVQRQTYTMCERRTIGPSSGVPLSVLWVIADALGCPIDVVVGREVG